MMTGQILAVLIIRLAPFRLIPHPFGLSLSKPSLLLQPSAREEKGTLRQAQGKRVVGAITH